MPALLEHLAGGKSVALVSDAGTPLISDPGWRLVSAAQEAGVVVVPIPGAVCGHRGVVHRGAADRPFRVRGVLAAPRGARAARLDALRGEQRTIVLYEAVHRVAETLAALRAAFGDTRRAAIARELTKTHEQIATGTLAELGEQIDAGIPLLGEFVLVVAGAAPAAPDETEARRVYALLAAELAPDQALKLAAAVTGVSRNVLYRLMRT